MNHRNRDYSNYWWLYLVRGIFAISFGIIMIFIPGPAFTTLIIFLGAFMIADGIFSILFSGNSRKSMKHPQWFFFVGLAGIVAGVFTLINPFISAITLVCFFAFWSFFAGIMEMMRAIKFRKEKKKEAWYVTSGILSILIAILLFVNPLEGAITLAIIFGIYALVIGISLISLSIKIRKRFSDGRRDMVTG